MTKTTRAGLMALGLLLAFGAGGCDDNKITADKVRRDMSPELQSVAMTHEQRKNREARNVDTTMRQFWDDLDMILLLDKPVRLTRYPLPN
jgi:hypothetical protein